MKNSKLQTRLNNDVLTLLDQQKSLFLSTINPQGKPHASYAPFAIENDSLVILISGLAAHTQNLQRSPVASVLIAQDETQAAEIFARLRLSYDMRAEVIPRNSVEWTLGVEALSQRFGDIIEQLTGLSDFMLFRLMPNNGRLVKGFGKAYDLLGGTLAGEEIKHVSVGAGSQELPR